MAQLRPSQIVLMASGAGLFLFSFMDLVKHEGNAWDDFGTTALPPLYGLATVAVFAAIAFTAFRPPERILTFRLSQLALILGFTSVLTYIGLWRVASMADLDLAAGFWLELLCAVGLVVGAVMETASDTGDAGSPGPGTTPPTPF
jgi:hypothetical protein